MATGDIKNNLRKLMVELKQVRYPLTQVDLKGLGQGTPKSFLPILHYIFLDYSIDLTEFFVKDYELYSKTDLRFVEIVYKLLRDVFHYKPPLTREQFLSIGYAERKVMELCDILKRCREKNSELNSKTLKMEKKHSHNKSKFTCKTTEIEKEVQRKSCTDFLVNTSQRLTLSSQNDTIMINEGNKKKEQERSSNQLQFHPQDIKKPTIRNTQSLEKDFLQSEVKSIRCKENDRTDTVKESEKKMDSIPGALNEVTNNNTKALNLPAFIPVPVTMTTIPKPSPELTLTPIGKTIHQPIPLSGSCHEQEDITTVSIIDLTDSTSVQQPKVVRHEYDKEIETRTSSGMSNQKIPLTSQDNELKLLKEIIHVLQEKLDSVLSQNNEMSARVVLLESRMKLLEEAPSKGQCENCMNTKYFLPNYKLNPNQFYSHAPVSSNVQREFGPISTAATTYPKLEESTGYVSGPVISSNRNLIDDFNNSQNCSAFQNTVDSKYVGKRHDYLSSHKLVPQASNITEISDDDDDGDGTSSTAGPKGSSLSCTPKRSTSAVLEAISPFSTTQEIHLKFSDPSTTATILNVERRLKETREMLANAARFAATSL